MHTFILVDYTTVRGSVATVTQGESGWLDLSPYQDLLFWVDVREASGSPSIVFQTSPTKDDALFQNMIASQAIAGGNVYVLKALLASASVPVARYVRWQLSGTPTWDATLRVIVAANSPGM